MFINHNKGKGPCAKVWIILKKDDYEGPDPGDLLVRASMSQINIRSGLNFSFYSNSITSKVSNCSAWC